MIARLCRMHSSCIGIGRKYLKLNASRTSIFQIARASSVPDFNAAFQSKYFDYQQCESTIYSWWESKGLFKPIAVSNNRSLDSNSKFVMPMPPPNITGHLHMGHAMFLTIQDALIRFQRMSGKETLWVPGTDHAGIATQMLVERQLRSEKGLSKHDLGRDAFLKQIWKWKDATGDRIIEQMKHLGSSPDWDRCAFTMDSKLNDAVIDAFLILHKRGLIYRGEYLVNWSPSLQTAISDLEVEYSEEKGKLFQFKYLIDGIDDESLTVATTRPETLFGDTAICVHPNDARYAHLVGRRARIPFTDKLIPVIADDSIDMAFGTGAVKITPAHDPHDYRLGLRLGLPMVNILNKDATLNCNVPADFVGLGRFEAREAVWSRLQAEGLAVGVSVVDQRVPRSQRGGDIVEPLLSTQWFVKTEAMANAACLAVETGRLKIVPPRYESTWYQWLKQPQDWCISRQLWWGHRIPVYYIKEKEKGFNSSVGSAKVIDKDNCKVVVARSESEAIEMAISLGHKKDSFEIVQEEDVLDTWFSSGLWPFATLGWRDPTLNLNSENKDLQNYYPANVLATGHDILFFWVARMVMLGEELTGRLPFETVYLHGLVRDSKGQKMSKTKGNVVDPIQSAAKFGSDAVRLAILSHLALGQDLLMSEENMEMSRNTVNKMWNIGKYIGRSLDALGKDFDFEESLSAIKSLEKIKNLHLSDRYIIARWNDTVDLYISSMNSYDLQTAVNTLLDFIKGDFADWYLETTKTRGGILTAQGRASFAILCKVWGHALRLLHPCAPFVTEVLWQQLPALDGRGDSGSIMTTPIASVSDAFMQYRDSEALENFRILQCIIKEIRNIRLQYKVPGNKKIATTIEIFKSKDSQSLSILGSDLASENLVLELLARVDPTSLRIVVRSIDQTKSGAKAGDDGSASETIDTIIEEGLAVKLRKADLCAVDSSSSANLNSSERARLQKQLANLEKDASVLTKRLNSEGFLRKASAEIIARDKSSLDDIERQIEQTKKIIDSLN